MWEAYRISEQNLPAFQELCQKFQRTPSIFRCQHDLLHDKGREEGERDELDDINRPTGTEILQEETEEPPPKKAKRDVSVSTAVTVNGITIEPSTPSIDIIAVQKKLIVSLNKCEVLKADEFKSYDAVGVPKKDILLISGQVLIKLCTKSVKYDHTQAVLMGKFLLLPKLLHTSHKLSTPVLNALVQVTQQHAAPVVEGVLVPLLRHGHTLQQQHGEMLVQLIPEVPSQLLVNLLSVLSTREHLGSETDIQILQELCQHSDPTTLATHPPILTALHKMAEGNASNITYGRCLLYVAKTFGPQFSSRELENLRAVVDSHKSSMRKVIDIMVKKLGR